VRQALLHPDICHREDEFSELLHRIQAKLLKAFVPGAESDYVAVVMTGSGTAAVEAALMSSLPHGRRMLILNNGVYGERMSQIIGLHRLGVSELKYEWTVRPDPEKLLLALRQHQEVHVVGMVHHETTTGLLNPVHEIAEIVDNQNRVFVLDAVSALAGETLNIAKSHIYMVAGTAGKCIQGFPGVSFVLVRKGFVEKMRAYPKRSWYLHLTHYIDNEGQGTIPFTPAVQVGDIIYLAGQIGTGASAQGGVVTGGIQAETRQTMLNIKDVLEKSGSDMEHVFKCTVFMGDMKEWDAMNEVYTTFFPNHKPARSALGSTGLALNAKVEIECLAKAK